MITVSFGHWRGRVGVFLVYERIYWRGRWTPLCRARKRYRSWLGYWGGWRALLIDVLEQWLHRLYRAELRSQDYTEDRYTRTAGRYDR